MPSATKGELEAVRRLSQRMFQKTSVAELVEETLHCALREVGAEAGSVLLADPEAKKLVFHYSVGETPVPNGTAIPWDQGIAGEVFRTGEPSLVGDVKKTGRHYGEVKKGFVTNNMITLPLKQWEGAPIGVMTVINKKTGALDERDLSLLMILSAFAALAIQQARNFENAKLAEVVHRLGDIGHDLKNLLTPVVMGSQLLREEFAKALQAQGPAGEVHRELLQEVIHMLEAGAQRSQERVKELADCVKGLSSKPVFKPCSLPAVVKEVLDALRMLAHNGGVSLAAEGLDGLPLIVADEKRLFNALYNLVNNAIPEVPKGGSVTVRAERERDGRSLVLSVADTGRGMPADVRDSLFSSRAISRKSGGTGLGTKIVKDAVEAHGGTISVESVEGEGTTFTIRLPVQPKGA